MRIEARGKLNSRHWKKILCTSSAGNDSMGDLRLDFISRRLGMFIDISCLVEFDQSRVSLRLEEKGLEVRFYVFSLTTYSPPRLAGIKVIDAVPVPSLRLLSEKSSLQHADSAGDQTLEGVSIPAGHLYIAIPPD